MVWLTVIVIHLLVCVLLFLGIHSGILKVHNYMFFVALLLPFWGAVVVLLLHLQIVLKKDGKAEIGVDKFKVKSELYKSISMDSGTNTQRTVPMEDALLINNPAERRALILDVLNDNPKDYIEFLQKAGDNDDTEVVHYAVTAMVELSKENDALLHMLEKQYEAEPENPEILEAYTDLLWECLSMNMMQGQVEKMNRELFSSLMLKKIAKGGSVEDYVRSVTNDLIQKNYRNASFVLERMEEQYPEQEDYFLLKIQYLAALKRSEDIQKLLAEVKEKQIYFSAKGKEAIAFWEN